MSMLCETQPESFRHRLPPVFNKRLYKAQAGIVLTDKIIKILQKPKSERRTSEQLNTIKTVVAALKDIHKGLQFIKEALCGVVTYERVEADVEISKKSEEKCLSCYYILNGSVEARYEINNGVFGSGLPVDNPKDCEISYTHVAGEYLGLVSGDGQQFDYPPPDKIRTIEASEFLRVDREQFHRAVRQVQKRYVKEIEDFIEGVAFFKTLPQEDKAKLVNLMARQEYPAGKVIVNQGDQPEHLFFVARGRCQYFRSIFIEEVDREEFVKLGQIEKGQFFGESNLLDTGHCFCSVSSIGSVTCFLVNKWALRTNENIIRILRENRRYFFKDDDIKHYIRSNELWQSFKRCTITELLKIKGKYPHTFDSSESSSTLSKASKEEDRDKRLFLKTTNSNNEVVSAPSKVKKSYVAPRSSRRRSSAILNCNAAAVVKAVLLLRRGSDTENEKGVGLPFSTRRSVSLQNFSSVNADAEPGRTTHKKRQDSRKILPIFRRTESAEIQTLRKTSTRLTSRDSISFNSRNTIPGKTRMGNKIHDTFGARKQASHISKSRKERNRKKDDDCSRPAEPFKEATFNMQSVERSSSFLSSVALEKSVVQNPNVVIKEVINTGIPGRRLSPKSYRRFERSIFDVVHRASNSKASSSNEDFTESPVLNPWNVSFASSKWLTNIRTRRRNACDRDESEESGQPPIIVIEEWLQSMESGSRVENAGDTSELVSPKKPGRTTTPVLENVAEESEEEILKYERERLPSERDRWHTPIHEVRDTCEKQLIEFKKDIGALEEQRRKYKYLPTEDIVQNENGENSEKEELATEQSDENASCTNKNVSVKKHYGTTEMKGRCRKYSLINDRRSRSNTFSEASVENCAVAQRLRRTKSLSRFRLISLSASNDISTTPPSICEHGTEVSMDQDQSDKIGREMQMMRIKSSRIEKRRLLLRKKIEELDRNT